MAFVPPSLAAASIAPLAAKQGNPQQPGDAQFSLGDVTFRNIEAPSELPVGTGRQMVAAHQLPGGTRVVQTFGVDPDDVTWSGTFYGDDVKARVATLRSYMVDGVERDLTWGDEQYRGIVTDFKPKYYHQARCGYALTFKITKDLNGAFTIAQPTSIDSQTSALLTKMDINQQIAAEADPVGVTPYAGDLSNIKVSAQNAGPLAFLSTADAQKFLSQIHSTVAGVQQYANTLAPTAKWLPNVLQIVSCLNLLAQNVGQGQAPNSVQKQGGNLFQIASQYYGDVEQAFSLMSANGLSSPHLPSTVLSNIILPPLNRRN